jgi:hypothetical protein
LLALARLALAGRGPEAPDFTLDPEGSAGTDGGNCQAGVAGPSVAMDQVSCSEGEET